MFAIVCHTGGEDEITAALRVYLSFIHTAGGDIQPCFGNVVGIKALAEAIHRVPFGGIYDVVSRDPFSRPCIDTGLKGGCAPITANIIFVPQTNAPNYFRLRADRFRTPWAVHRAAMHFAAAPKDFSGICGSADLISCLPKTILTVPKQPGPQNIDADGIL